MEMIEKVGLLPLVNVSEPGKAVPIAKALADGGIPIVEVTLRDKTALESLANIHKELPDTLVGAGTVKSPDKSFDNQVLSREGRRYCSRSRYGDRIGVGNVAWSRRFQILSGRSFRRT